MALDKEKRRKYQHDYHLRIKDRRKKYLAARKDHIRSLATKNRAKNREHYNAMGRKYWAARSKEHTLKHRSRAISRAKNHKAYIAQFKNACSVCGEAHKSCLQFHHKDPTTKSIAVAKMRQYSKKRILDEISKCTVLCANCHCKLHWQEFYEGDT